MKLLMLYMDRFSYKSTTKTLEYTDDISEEREVNDVQAAFIQIEKEDEVENGIKSRETKLVKNLKWASKKNNTKKILLHSFAHLSQSKASPEFTKAVLDNTEKRLANSGYEVFQTPFGYFFDLELKSPGFSLARVFKDI